MPKIKYLTPKKGKTSGERLAQLIGGYMFAAGHSTTSLAKRADLGMTQPTLAERIRNPMRFRLDELLCVARRLDIPLEEIWACIRE